ncbi:unnamed protein product, partial [Pocillopora meandrina]
STTRTKVNPDSDSDEMLSKSIFIPKNPADDSASDLLALTPHYTSKGARMLPIEDLHADENSAYKHQATWSKTCRVEMVADHEVDYFQILDYRKIYLIDNTYHLVQRNRVCESCKDLKTIVSYF